MRLYIIRHADPDYPGNTITPTGHQEAAALARRMKDVGLSRIYTSPINRALLTAQYTSDITGIPIVTLPWTAELSMGAVTCADGTQNVAWVLDGEIIRGGDLPTNEDWHQHPALCHYDFLAHYRRIQKDSDAFLQGQGYQRDRGIYRVLQHNEERIAVFCHAGFGVSWLAHLLEIPLPLAWSSFYLAPSSVTTVLMETRTPEIAVPRALSVSDTSHVYAENLSESRRGLMANID